jgi:hypothetical protein
LQSGEGGEEGGAPGGLKRRTSTRERAKPVAYNPTEQDLDTARRRKDLKEQVRPHQHCLFKRLQVALPCFLGSLIQPGWKRRVRCAVIGTPVG